MSYQDKILSWPECAQLCKIPVPSLISTITFEWGPTDHVLRRFFGTKSLPHLREIHVIMPDWNDGPLRLLRGLSARGRAIQKLSITTSLDLAHTRRLRFVVTSTVEGKETARAIILSGMFKDDDVHYAAIALGLESILSGIESSSEACVKNF